MVGKGERVINIVFDFDYTLTTEFMENSILRARGVEPCDFWSRVLEIEREQGGDEATFVSYFLHLIRSGPLKGLTKDELRKSGEKLEFFPGLPDFFRKLGLRFENDDVRVNFHVISSGFREVIEGSSIFPYLSSVYATRFSSLASEDGEIDSFVELVVTAKKVEQLRRIGMGNFSDMIYVGDGQSDLPAFKFVKNRKGLSICVFDPETRHKSHVASQMFSDGIVDHTLPADFREGSRLFCVIEAFIKERLLRQGHGSVTIH
jgi:phosphoserine phosphatase